MDDTTPGLSASARSRLGAYLRAATHAAQTTAAQVARDLSWDNSKLTRLYAGELVKPDAYQELCAHLGLDWDQAQTSSDELARSLEKIQRAPATSLTSTAQMGARVVAICAQKGGVGKTTLASALSVVLADRGARVLLVDLDSQANATDMMLGVTDSQTGQELLEALADEETQALPLLETPYDLALVPSGRKMASAESKLNEQIGGGTGRIKRLLRPHLSDYDFIILDTPPSLGRVTISAMFAATHVLIPVRADGHAIKAAQKTVQTCLEIRDHFNVEFELTGMVLFAHDSRTVLGREALKQLRALGHVPLLEPYIPDSVVWKETTMALEPAIRYAPDHKAVRPLLRLVDTLQQRWDEDTSQEVATS